MPKYYCAYCDIFLTHDSITVRRSHNAGKNHKLCVKHYYEAIIRKQFPDAMPAIGQTSGGAPFYGLKPVGPTTMGAMGGGMRAIGGSIMMPQQGGPPPGGPPGGLRQFNQPPGPPRGGGPHGPPGGYGGQNANHGQPLVGNRQPPGGPQYGRSMSGSGNGQGDPNRDNQRGGPPSEYGARPQYGGGGYAGRPGSGGGPNGHGPPPPSSFGNGNLNGQHGPPTTGPNQGYGGGMSNGAMGPPGGQGTAGGAPGGMHPDRARMLAQGR